MAKKICWVLPSGQMHSTNKNPESEKKIQEYSTLLERVIFFFV